MQNNEQTKPEDPAGETEDEDFDLDDFDDDLADESWDEFDDEHDPATDSDIEIASPKKKSFLQKNMVFIALGAVLLAGAAYVMGSAPPETATPADPAAATDETSQFDIADNGSPEGLSPDSDLPPMPSPIHQTLEQEVPEAEITDAGMEPLEIVEEAPADLTPMPEEAPAEENILAELDIENVPAVPVEENELVAAEETQEISILEELELPQEDSLPETPEVSDISEIDESIDFLPQEPVIEIEAEISAEPEEEIIPQEITEPAVTTAEPAEENTSEEVQELQSQLVSLNNELSAKIAERDVKIEELTSTIEELEKKLEKAEKEKPQPKPEPEKTTAKSDEPEKPAAQEKPAQTQKSEPKQWVLRAAQPGQAMIAQEGSNEMQNVKVGDTLKNIGRVTSIAVENGKWVVRGTTGMITQ